MMQRTARESASLAYRVGGLLYMPAFQKNIVEKIERGSIPCLTSMAFCLEDSIRDDAVKEAEQALGNTLLELARRNIPREKMPLLFLRVRSPEQMERLHGAYRGAWDILTGYILPKFDLENGKAYLHAARKIRRESQRELYLMPILESPMVADAATRLTVLGKLRQMLDEVRPLILNIRVGANDFSNLYGLRRPVHRTVYDIGVLRDILTDILNFFAGDYVVSGPVWNHFGKEWGPWAEGLERELEFDRLNGFIGKTAIHPSQLPLIAKSLTVPREDYEDALALLNWDHDLHGVSKSVGGGRMNELKCHENWARRTKILGELYGIREDWTEENISG